MLTKKRAQRARQVARRALSHAEPTLLTLQRLPQLESDFGTVGFLNTPRGESNHHEDRGEGQCGDTRHEVNLRSCIKHGRLTLHTYPGLSANRRR